MEMLVLISLIGCLFTQNDPLLLLPLLYCYVAMADL